MAETSVQWADYTFNPWSGCSKVSAGCAHCYAEVNYSVKMRGVKWGPRGNRVVAAESMWKQPLKWDRQAREAGERKRVFCASLADVFEDWSGPMLDSRRHTVKIDRESDEFYANTLPDGPDTATMQDVRNRLFALIDQTPNLDWMVLTKRPANIVLMMSEAKCPTCRGRGGWETGPHSGTCRCNDGVFIRHNLWLGTSVENQQTADERIPHLLRVPAAVRFLSCEPLLGPVDLRGCVKKWSCRCGCHDVLHPLPCSDECKAGIGHQNAIDWVIVGGESGPGARPCGLAWIRSIVAQCKAARVACFVKQLGAHVLSSASGEWPRDTGHFDGRKHLIDKKGGAMEEWPRDLRIREFPTMEARR